MKQDIIHRADFKHVIACIGDTQVGSRYALAGPKWDYTSEGNELTRNAGQKKIWKFWLKCMGIIEKWDADTVFLLGDLVNGLNRKEGGLQMMTTNIFEQANHVTKLLEPLCANKKVFGVTGSGYHQAREYSVEHEICKDLGGKFFGHVGNLRFKDSKRNVINMAHGASQAFIYRSMILDREAMHVMNAVAQGKLPPIRVVVRGHWHSFIHIHFPHIHLIQNSCFCAFVPWQGAMKLYAKFQPDIGFVLIFIDQQDRVMVHHYLMDVIPHIGDGLWDI